MSEFQAISDVKRLSSSNYNTWSTCISVYLLGQDLWEEVDGANTTEPRIDTNGAIHKWRVKSGKALFIIKQRSKRSCSDIYGTLLHQKRHGMC